MRYFVEVAYHGKSYHGWQIQENAHTVQAEIQTAIHQTAASTVEIVGSGRTDAGVHAIQQVFHVDLPQIADLSKFVYQLNSILPPDIAIRKAWGVPGQAHARFDAISRSYQYHLGSIKDPFKRDLQWFFAGKVDVPKMQQACNLLLEHRDFQCFSKVKTAVNNFTCELTTANWKQNNETLVFYVSANRFLRGMVRAMVGTLLQVGQSKIDLQEFKEILASKDRRSAGPSVPAHGLFLAAVDYPSWITKT